MTKQRRRSKKAAAKRATQKQQLDPRLLGFPLTNAIRAVSRAMTKAMVGEGRLILKYGNPQRWGGYRLPPSALNAQLKKKSEMDLIRDRPKAGNQESAN